MAREQEISLGQTAMRAHEKQGVPFVTLNYAGPEAFLPLPYPDGDEYLNKTAVPALRKGETVVCTTLIPGLLDYYREIGLLNNSMHVVEVEPKPTDENRYAFPANDPLAILRGQVIFDPTGRKPLYLASTFSGPKVAEQEHELGLESLGRPDSWKTNNKALLRLASDKHGINMVPGEVATDWEQAVHIANDFGNAPKGAWVKFPTGSGGDLGDHLKKVTPETVLASRNKIRNAVLQSFRRGKYGIKGEEFWPEDIFAPEGFGMVIESDVRNHGRLAANGSTQFVTHKDGRVQIVGHFQQITTEDGEYLGNRPFFPHSETEERILEQVAGVASHCMNDNMSFGLKGVDWFLVDQKPNGNGNGTVRYNSKYNGEAVHSDETVFANELNDRPTANSPAKIIADKLGAMHWININAYTDVPIHSVRDYERIVGERLAYGDFRRGGQVVPQAFRTQVTRGETVPSGKFKMMILGKSPEHCDEIMDRLQERGVRFTPKAA